MPAARAALAELLKNAKSLFIICSVTIFLLAILFLVHLAISLFNIKTKNKTLLPMIIIEKSKSRRSKHKPKKISSKKSSKELTKSLSDRKKSVYPSMITRVPVKFDGNEKSLNVATARDETHLSVATPRDEFPLEVATARDDVSLYPVRSVTPAYTAKTTSEIKSRTDRTQDTTHADTTPAGANPQSLNLQGTPNKRVRRGGLFGALSYLADPFLGAGISMGSSEGEKKPNG